MQANLDIERIKENGNNINQYLSEAVIKALDAKEEILIRNFEDQEYDVRNLQFINKIYENILQECQVSKDVTTLSSLMRKLKILILDLPFIISSSVFDLDTKEDLTIKLSKIQEKVKEINVKIREQSKIENKMIKGTIDKFCYDEYLTRDLAERAINEGKGYFKANEFKKAKECYIEALFLYTIIEKNLSNFDPNLKVKIDSIKQDYADAKVKEEISPKLDDYTNLVDSIKKKKQKAIDASSNCALKDFDPIEMKLTNFLILKFDAESFIDPEFIGEKDLVKIFNVSATSMRMSLGPMQLVSLKDCKVSLLNKNLKKKSALGASLVSILLKQKEALQNVVFPQQQGTRIPICNPYGKYTLKLYINGTYKQITIDDYTHFKNSQKPFLSDFGNELDFYFSLVNKAFQKLKFLGYKIDKNPAIYNYMLLGPNWIPDFSILRGADKAQQDWELIKNSSKYGITICRRKPDPKNYFQKRAYYNILSTLEWQEYKIILVQNVSVADEAEIPEEFKLQISDVGFNESLFNKIMGNFVNVISDKNGIFITSFPKLADNFDHVYINWNASFPIYEKIQYQGEMKCGDLFENVFAIHRSDNFVLTSDSKFNSIENNPQFKIHFKDNYARNVVWVLLEWHHNIPQTDRQLSFNIHPKRNNKVYIVSEKTSMILKTFNKNFGQRFILGKILLENQQHLDEFVCVLNYHTHSDLKMDITENLSYSLYFYSTNKLYAEELEADLRYSKEIKSSLMTDISCSPAEIGFVDAPQIFLKPVIKLDKQKFHFLVYLHPDDTSLSFNIYDATYQLEKQKIYHQDPIYASTQDFKKFDFFEGDFDISKNCLSKFNLQIVPRYGKVPIKSGYKLSVRSNIDFELFEIPIDEHMFSAQSIKGSWDKSNSAGRENYIFNPKYLLEIGSMTYARLRIHSADPSIKINASLYDSPFKFDEIQNWDIFSPGLQNLKISTKSFEKNIDFSNEAWAQVSDVQLLHEGTYIIIPSTLEPNQFSKKYFLS